MCYWLLYHQQMLGVPCGELEGFASIGQAHQGPGHSGENAEGLGVALNTTMKYANRAA